MSPALQNSLKLYTFAAVSAGSVASGFAYLSFPVGIILKVTGAALTVIGTFGVQTLWSSVPDEIKTKEREQWTASDLEHMVEEIRSQMTYKSLALNAAIIGLISSCYLITVGGI